MESQVSFTPIEIKLFLNKNSSDTLLNLLSEPHLLEKMNYNKGFPKEGGWEGTGVVERERKRETVDIET